MTEHCTNFGKLSDLGCAWRSEGEFELHAGGGFLRSETAKQLTAGDGLVIELEVSERVCLSLVACVRWIRVDDRVGPVGAWVDFHEPEGEDQARIYACLRENRGRVGPLLIRGVIERRCCLRRLSSARESRCMLYVGLSGRLEPGLAELFARELDEHLCEMRERSSSLALFLDAGEFRPSPAPSLDHVRRWLEILAAAVPLLGVLHGGGSVAMMQLSRIVREAGVADSLMRVDEIDAARATWTMLCDELAQLSPVS
ncbi:hypothetical protein G6O69_08460 [Pseudenhygromyxa sp. WMMC2535]|uniref:hypothetical protein n=1 Tax=Pseudenhygromyxa sp. WMMC2535 TaxID=2712867 RepID=UPI001552BC44|nr:hypothetical protein [Pseudenhygromyxa sp. WMMC2535]NVB37864.1 hypothetical protein [Pseudenhygromyxa sp. WMMC2535]